MSIVPLDLLAHVHYRKLLARFEVALHLARVPLRYLAACSAQHLL
jgi:hypothetical protein